MLKQLRRTLKRAASTSGADVPSATARPPLAQLNLNHLPLLSSGELIQILDADNLMRSIRRLVAIQDAHWRALYQPALNRFLEACQLAPASMAHHHAGPGGLAAHTLESLEIALQLRKPLVLPRNADPETSARQEHVWTYALFVAVLLHDIGKLHTTIRLRLSSNQYWHPYLKLDQHKGEHYRVEFADAPYKLHQRIATTGLHMIPKAGMAWLNQHPHILAHVCAYLYGDHYEAGIIGELAQKADGQSVASNLKNQGDRTRFPGAPAIPLVDRLIIGLRTMLDAKELKINGGHGADGWSDGEFLWLVCGTVARKLIEYLRQEGMTQVPTDNNRIFDTLQEHGYIVPTLDGKAIWHTVITGADGAYRFELTMLKFEVARLVPPSRRPAAFDGTITVLERADTGQPAQTSRPTDTAPASSTPIAPATAPEGTTVSVLPSLAIEPAPDSQDSLPDWMRDNPSGTSDAPEIRETAPVHDANAGTNLMDGTDTERGETAPVAHTSTAALNFDDIRPRHLDDNTGQFFMDWIARMLRNGKLPVNRQDAVIHMVPEGALVVSPRAFKEYVAFFDLYHRENSNKLTNDEAARHVQKKVEKLRQNIKTPSGMSVHSYLINGPNRVSRVSGFLFDPIRLFGHVSPPAINTLLVSSASLAKAKSSMS